MIGLQPATFEEFERESARGNVVPVVRTVLADLQTPVGAFLRVAGGGAYAFLLESVEGGERIARYSFIGADPEMIVRGRGDTTLVERRGETEELRGVHATDFLRDYFRARRLARRAGLAPMAGGAVGYLAYEAARWFEPVLEKSLKVSARTDDSEATNDSEGTDDAVFMLFRTVLAFDRVRQLMEITSVVFTEEAADSRERLKELYDAAVAETERVEKLLMEGVASPLRVDESRAVKGDDVRGGESRFESKWSREEFESAVVRIKEHIAAGDCYQAVLSLRFSKSVGVNPVQIYRALRAANPSPYMYLLRMGDETVVGASPEMLVRCRGQRLDYRPIAGTRKRGATETEDWLLGEEMRSDEKEVAEHTMLVDLGRNDLGRVADYGSVEVGELMTIERYSHVQHLVTALRARLRDDRDRFDALAACFPAGTVTGAPKVRAMQIVAELEPAARGLYAGAVLYADYADNLDSCIAIRTVVLRDSRARVQAGAGIVADSVPEREYEESLNKARTIFNAVEMAERGL